MNEPPPSEPTRLAAVIRKVELCTGPGQLIIGHPEGGGIDVEPVISDPEVIQTLEFLCMAAMGVAVATNQMLGGTPGGAALNGIADRYTDLSSRTKAAG
jgi:hypothetical protein